MIMEKNKHTFLSSQFVKQDSLSLNSPKLIALHHNENSKDKARLITNKNRAEPVEESNKSKDSALKEEGSKKARLTKQESVGISTWTVWAKFLSFSV